jgi:hypothetical protein
VSSSDCTSVEVVRVGKVLGCVEESFDLSPSSESLILSKTKCAENC